MAPDVYFEGPGCQRTALDVYFEGPGRQRTAPDVYFEGKVLGAKERLWTFISKVQNAEGMFQTHLKVLFEGKTFKLFLLINLLTKRSVYNVSFLFFQVKKAETSSGLLYRRQRNLKQVPDSHIEGKEIRNRVLDSYIEGKGIRKRVPDSHIEDKGSRKLGLPYEGFPIRRQENPKTNSGLPYRR
ncbi:hypothetical protein GLOIN_2v1780677 [Rhizophagus irregularis DAOM 181602=DAOM 197198]|nr:hypothetical protein GLOIN_2v1780677 [Rhizophagus irregularis DAOM 181602=DAOM 197198]